jgi:hypothetical protein
MPKSVAIVVALLATFAVGLSPRPLPAYSILLAADFPSVCRCCASCR